MPAVVDERRICRRCMTFQEAEEAEKYVALLPQDMLVSPEKAEERMQVCEHCDFLCGSTCRVCGCFIVYRANAKAGRCPKKKWQ